jgi:hypothetical protein
MQNLAEFWKANLNEDNQIAWPENEKERKQLACLLFGTAFIESLDYYIDLASDFVHHPNPAKPFVRKNAAYRRDKAYREIFSELTDAQKEMVMKLIRDVASGVLFSTLVRFDRFHNAEIDITVIDRKSNERVAIAPEVVELHEQFFDWVQRFSKYNNELAGDI